MVDNSINCYKVVLLGEGRVGKTSILLRYAENSYLEGRTPTLQASYVDKHIMIEEQEEIKHSSGLRASTLRPKRSNREAQLSIWDTAGQERYHSLGPIYYRNANGAVLVYDITDASSFVRVQRWVKELRKMVGDRNKICLIIVGNKADLSRQRAVDAEEAKSYANSVDAKFIEVSAKTGSGVEDVFVKLTILMLDTIRPKCRTTSYLANASDILKKSANQTVKISSDDPSSQRGMCC